MNSTPVGRKQITASMTASVFDCMWLPLLSGCMELKSDILKRKLLLSWKEVNNNRDIVDKHYATEDIPKRTTTKIGERSSSHSIVTLTHSLNKMM